MQDVDDKKEVQSITTLTEINEINSLLSTARWIGISSSFLNRFFLKQQLSLRKPLRSKYLVDLVGTFCSYLSLGYFAFFSFKNYLLVHFLNSGPVVFGCCYLFLTSLFGLFILFSLNCFETTFRIVLEKQKVTYFLPQRNIVREYHICWTELLRSHKSLPFILLMFMNGLVSAKKYFKNYIHF